MPPTQHKMSFWSCTGGSTSSSTAKLTTWLFRICMRVASDRRRAAPARRELLIDAPEREGSSPTPAAELEQRQSLALAEATLDGLPDDQRAVFVLFEIEEMSGEEIALALEIPVGTVRSRLRLARDSVKAAMVRREASARFDQRARATEATDD